MWLIMCTRREICAAQRHARALLFASSIAAYISLKAPREYSTAAPYYHRKRGPAECTKYHIRSAFSGVLQGFSSVSRGAVVVRRDRKVGEILVRFEELPAWNTTEYIDVNRSGVSLCRNIPSLQHSSPVFVSGQSCPEAASKAGDACRYFFPRIASLSRAS